jgi:hypothetical protein
MQSKATTVQQYLAELPEDRRRAIEAVREVILKNLDKDYEEGMGYGMIGYYVPHRVYPAGYHCDPKMPLPFAGLASQKNHMSVYLMSVYGEGNHWKSFREAWAKTGKKLDMGKCCIRFRKLEDVALDVIGDAIRKTPVKGYIDYYERAILTMNKAAAERSAARKKAGTKATGAKSAKAAKKAAKRTSKKTTSRKAGSKAKARR